MGKLHHFAHAYIEVQFNTFGINAVKQCRYEFRVYQLTLYAKSNGVYATGNQLFCLFISFGGIGYLYILSYEPAVASLVASCIREHTGLQILTTRRQILFAVERVYLKTLLGSPNHLLVVVGTFQFLYNLVFPILGRYRREIAKKLLLFLVHNIEFCNDVHSCAAIIQANRKQTYIINFYLSKKLFKFLKNIFL